MDTTQWDPERGWKVTLMLTDAAQVAEGKLNVLGAGWTMCGSPANFTLAGLIEVPWHQTNRQHRLRLELIDLDGNEALVPTSAGMEPLFAEAGFEAGRPPGVRAGSAITMPFALPFVGVPLPAGAHLEWRLTIDGEAHEDWRLAFSTLPNAQSEAA